MQSDAVTNFDAYLISSLTHRGLEAAAKDLPKLGNRAPVIPVNPLFAVSGTVFTSKFDLQPAEAIEDASKL
jgi:hypothetical protein